MKLNASKFAVAIWIVAAMLAITQLSSNVYLMNPASHMNIGAFLVDLSASLLYSGGLAALGAGVYLLGEIRDRLPERSN
jgi:hypothetical protein